jgi:hypothetical protein
VHLLAQSGWDTGDELAALRTAAERGEQIDNVVLVYCLNDVADIMPEWTRTWKRIVQYGSPRSWLQRHSYLVDAVYQRITFLREPDFQNYFQFVRDGYRGVVWQQQMQRLDSLRHAVEAGGGSLQVVTFPFLHALGAHYEYQFIHDQLHEFWRKRRVPHLDLLGIYRDLPPRKIVVNRFDAHPNEYAHRLAAVAIGEFLERSMSGHAATSPAPTGQRGPLPRR